MNFGKVSLMSSTRGGTYRLEGANQLISQFKGAKGVNEKFFLKANKQYMAKLYGKLQEYTPLDTGFLRTGRNANKYMKGATGGWHWEEYVKPFYAKMENPTPYAYDLETSHYHPRRSGKIPFLEPAIKNTRKDLEKEYEQAGDKVLKAISKH